MAKLCCIFLSSFAFRLSSNLLSRCRGFGLVAVLFGFRKELGNIACGNVRNFSVVEAERDFPGCHDVGLHAVAVAIAYKLLAERFNFRNFIAFHDDHKLVFTRSGQECVLSSALALEK